MQPHLPSHHRAWRWRGSAEPLQLVLEDMPMPGAGPGQVLVRNAVIGLNPVDWKVLGGLDGWQPGHVPGVDGTGQVVAVGAGVPADWLGRRVAYHTSLHGHGSFAEFAPVAARALLRLPDNVDFETAAGVPCPGLTALLALKKIPVRPGQSLLVGGAGGAVGQYLVQLADARGFAVAAMAHPRHRDRLRALGAARVVEPLREGQPTLEPRQFHAVIDCVDEHHAARLSAALRANGHLVCIQGRVSDWPCAPFGRALSLHEVALGALHVHGDDADWAALVAAGEQLLADIDAGRVQPPDTVTRGFDQLAQLLDDLRHRSFSGKPVVRVG